MGVIATCPRSLCGLASPTIVSPVVAMRAGCLVAQVDCMHLWKIHLCCNGVHISSLVASSRDCCATKMFFKAALLELFGLHHFSHAMYVFSRWRVAIYVGGVYFLKLHVCSVAVVCCAVAFCVSH